jgi:hypothetical protein
LPQGSEHSDEEPKAGSREEKSGEPEASDVEEKSGKQDKGSDGEDKKQDLHTGLTSDDDSVAEKGAATVQSGPYVIEERDIPVLEPPPSTDW